MNPLPPCALISAATTRFSRFLTNRATERSNVYFPVKSSQWRDCRLAVTATTSITHISIVSVKIHHYGRKPRENHQGCQPWWLSPLISFLLPLAVVYGWLFAQNNGDIMNPGTARTTNVYYKQIMALSMKGYRVISVDIPRVWNNQEWVQAFEKFLDVIDVHHYVLTGIPNGPHEPFIADSVDFVLHRLMGMGWKTTLRRLSWLASTPYSMETIGSLPRLMSGRITLE
ncbi:unnamed protein product [Lactuca saligna]|uniref:Uncharacterized protein n=1 Tax=Lactuca saligna TaxID=75948 RepID=A0AA35YTG5_LACSI|nr:unnamed protein product [Lactuca saligna]